MSGRARRPLAFWFVTAFLALSAFGLLAGQTTAVFDYDAATRLGLVPSADKIGTYGMQVSRAFGVADTLLYVPLAMLSLLGLTWRKQWSVVTSAAFFAISAYWSLTSVFLLLFLDGIPGYALEPPPSYWMLLALYIGAGVCGLGYLAVRAERLIA